MEQSTKYERVVLQNLTELERLIAIFKRENVRSYLEIGSKFGGSLWRIASSLPVGSLIVAVDLPHGDTSFKETQQSLEACVARLQSRGYKAHLILGDSTAPAIIEAVRSLAVVQFDACLIDANHTLPYVIKDWENYGSLSRIVCFHDIGWKARPEPSKKMPIQVPILWQQLKKQYRHEEINLEPRDCGLGVLWR